MKASRSKCYCIISAQLWGTLTPSGMGTAKDLDGSIFLKYNLIGIEKMWSGIEGGWMDIL